VAAGGVPRSDVTIDDVKAAEVIWGQSVIKLKGSTIRREGKRKKQSIIAVPLELIKIHQDVELAIDYFFVNRQVFFTTFSTKVCFTTVTHLVNRTKEAIWAALLATYKMYLLQRFCVVVIRGDQEFAAISDLAVALPTTPSLDWAAASQHCGLVEQNIRFLKEKTRSIRHSLPFEWVPGIMVVWMVLHIVKFVNGFPRKGGVEHFSPGEITCAWALKSTVRLQRMLNPITAWLLVHEGLSRLAAWGICQAARYSLHWILAIELFGTNGWYSQCHLRLLQE
jgi:hypothetical protein